MEIEKLINILARGGYLRGETISLVMIFAIISILILIYLIFKTVQSGKKLKLLIQDTHTTAKGIDFQIVAQKTIFHLWLTMLKFLAVLQPIIFFIRIMLSLARAFDAMEMAGVFDPALALYGGMTDFFINLGFGISMTIFPICIFFIFSFILKLHSNPNSLLRLPDPFLLSIPLPL